MRRHNRYDSHRQTAQIVPPSALEKWIFRSCVTFFINQENLMTATLDACTRESIRFEFAEVQTVAITLEGHRCKPRLISACLLNLSSHGAKLAVPDHLPEGMAFKLKLSVQQFALEFYVSAKVCWTACEGENGSVIGCQFNPSLPAGLLNHLAEGGKLDRRSSDRERSTSAIKIVRELAKAGAQEKVALQNYSAGGFCIEARQPLSP